MLSIFFIVTLLAFLFPLGAFATGGIVVQNPGTNQVSNSIQPDPNQGTDQTPPTEPTQPAGQTQVGSSSSGDSSSYPAISSEASS